MNYNYCCIHKQRTHEKTFVFSHALSHHYVGPGNGPIIAIAMPAPKPQSQFTPQPKSTRFFCSTPSLFGVSYTLILSPPSHFVFPILFYVLVHSLYHVIAFTTIFIVFFALFFISLDIGNTWLINFNYYKIICMNYFDEIYFHSHSLQHNCVTTLAHFCD